MDNYSYTEYPYGKFPLNYTKSGQQKRFEELKTNISQQNTQIQNINANNQQPPQNNSFNISSLIPLIKLMGNKKSISSTDMLGLLLPMISGENGTQISEIMNLIKPSTTENQDVIEDVVDGSTTINEYKRVE